MGENMKKGIKFALILALLLFINPVFAKTIKVVAQTTNSFDPYDPPEVFYAKILEKVSVEENKVVPKGTIRGNVVKVSTSKRGKRNGYLVIQISGFKEEGANVFAPTRNDIRAKVTRYKKTDLKELGISSATSIAGLFVDHIAIPINFARGMITPYENKSRLKSGVQKAYEKSTLSYISKGEEIDLKTGELVVLTVKIKDEND